MIAPEKSPRQLFTGKNPPGEFFTEKIPVSEFLRGNISGTGHTTSKLTPRLVDLSTATDTVSRDMLSPIGRNVLHCSREFFKEILEMHKRGGLGDGSPPAGYSLLHCMYVNVEYYLILGDFVPRS